MPMPPIPPLTDKNLCTGCGACDNGCPKDAIHMLPDREGFLYPTVTDACVQCGHCAHICPIGKHRELRPEPTVFAVWNVDRAVREASMGGGVVPLLAQYVLDAGGAVFAASLDASLQISHAMLERTDQLSHLQDLKPVQSRIGKTYRQVQQLLSRRRKVLFIGTPCQVDGLYRYLGDRPEQLLTVDVLCSGVSSPGVWEHLVQSISYIEKKPLQNVQFHRKSDGEPYFRACFADGSVLDMPFRKSELGRGILRGLLLRPSCHFCSYTSTDRVGDLTLGAFEHLPREACPDGKNTDVSMMIVNSVHGAHMFDLLPLHKERYTLAQAAAGSAALRTPPARSADRAAFFDAYARQPFQQVRHRFLSHFTHQVPPTPLRKLLRRKKENVQ